ncbi:uncharacterized protein LOC121055023 [Oryza brachyantha]|uniref:uncharacterized protein LOC121055023 n=1 Tax=Oryza brachyantha TaxID=4533 RepID=UPI001ADA9F02|nr:uncharacterized protein LOC121055023 [Oryza brachyantha]
MPSSSCLQCNLCSGMLALFKRRPRALLLRRAVGRMNDSRRRRRRRRAGSFSSVRAVFWPLMSMRSEADRNDVVDRPPTSSTDDSGGRATVRAPSPSLDSTPSAPASTTAARVLALQAQLGEAAALASASTKLSTGNDKDDGVEEACRSFENHLMEMLVEERKVRDLMDVEELLCCWEKLRSPVFVQLVGRFYGELCMDLFSGRDTDLSSESDELSF